MKTCKCERCGYCGDNGYCTLSDCRLEETEDYEYSCDCCGNVVESEDQIAHCRHGDYCRDCIADMITYDNALAFLKDQNLLLNFIFSELCDMYEPDWGGQPSEKFMQIMEDVYRRCKADDIIRGVGDFRQMLIHYIVDEGFDDAEIFVDFIQGEGKKWNCI